MTTTKEQLDTLIPAEGKTLKLRTAVRIGNRTGKSLNMRKRRKATW